MKTIYWAVTAIMADLGVFLSGWTLEHSALVLLGIALMHGLLSLALAFLCTLLMPARLRKPPLLVTLLLFCLTFMAPVLGAVAVLFISHVVLHRLEQDRPMAQLHAVALPEFDTRLNQGKRGGQGAIRVRLEAHVPQQTRLQSLLTLQAVPQKVANPILEDLLSDDVEDVRLLAFGMLDAKEKGLAEHIRRERAALPDLREDAQKAQCLYRLASLHWELVYTALAQGELRHYMLMESRRYVDAALDIKLEHEPGLHYLHARLLMIAGEYDAAVSALGQAMTTGLAEASALPYMAEAAFQQRRFEYVHGIMQRLTDLELSNRTRAVVSLWTEHVSASAYDHLSSRAQAVVDLWVGRDHVHNFCDHRVLHHL